MGNPRRRQKSLRLRLVAVAGPWNIGACPEPLEILPKRIDALDRSKNAEIWTQQRKFSHKPAFAGPHNCYQGEPVRIEVQIYGETPRLTDPQGSRGLFPDTTVEVESGDSSHCRMEARRPRRQFPAALSATEFRFPCMGRRMGPCPSASDHIKQGRMDQSSINRGLSGLAVPADTR